MRLKDASLLVCVCCFAMKWQFFQPQDQRVPVDEEDYFQRDERIFQRHPRETCVAERDSIPGECAQQNPIFAIAVVDVDVQTFVRNAEPEIER